jgi:hypothetical protein
MPRFREGRRCCRSGERIVVETWLPQASVADSLFLEARFPNQQCTAHIVLFVGKIAVLHAAPWFAARDKNGLGSKAEGDVVFAGWNERIAAQARFTLPDRTAWPQMMPQELAARFQPLAGEHWDAQRAG